ncbi:hypothetical protein BDQ12DRAFT_692789 [Crucibulum laeve]|uniref:Uncharacterized protein n=1 Tax=Crucibulum laeve TaxID=68775 RepID=A0A5C3LGG0_9AGAR|nr:hypothetical protein BDQ12DRAFT_692789 [Crucibulum laeve]
MRYLRRHTKRQQSQSMYTQPRPRAHHFPIPTLQQDVGFVVTTGLNSVAFSWSKTLRMDYSHPIDAKKYSQGLERETRHGDVELELTGKKKEELIRVGKGRGGERRKGGWRKSQQNGGLGPGGVKSSTIYSLTSTAPSGKLIASTGSTSKPYTTTTCAPDTSTAPSASTASIRLQHTLHAEHASFPSQHQPPPCPPRTYLRPLSSSSSSFYVSSEPTSTFPRSAMSSSNHKRILFLLFQPRPLRKSKLTSNANSHLL